MLIKILDKEFRPYISSERLAQEITRLAQEVEQQMQGKRPLFISILNGSFMFASDFIRAYQGECEISFVRFSSYQGMESTHQVKQLLGLPLDIAGRDVVVIEDIVDTGRTIKTVVETLMNKGATSVQVVTLLDKPSRRVVDVTPDYIGFKIGNEFVVGFGMDFNQDYRCLPYIGVLKDECYQIEE